jgi:ABC-type phosphate transport system ATPase subunit
MDKSHATLKSDGSKPQNNEQAAVSTAIHISGFNAWYGTYHALKNINIDIPERQVTAFIGPSGCGKSTLLRWVNRINDSILTPEPRGRSDCTMRIFSVKIRMLLICAAVWESFSRNPIPFQNRFMKILHSVSACI